MIKYEKVFVLDTNILLESASNIFKISENGKNLIVLPETVIDEMDTKKSGFDEINFQAREFGRTLSEATVIATRKNSELNETITELKIDNTRVDIISFKDYNIKDANKSIMNDRKIIEVAKFAASHYGLDSTLLSNDVMCRIRAISFGVESHGLSKNLDDIEVDFVKVVHDFDPSLLNKMEHNDIHIFVDDHKPQNFCYHFKCTDGNEQLAYIVNNRISFIDDSLFKGMSVKPINVGQKFAVAGMLDERVDFSIIEALAGSGKTLLAVSAGIKLVKNRQFDKIVYIRNSVESVDKGEEVGYLPGLDSKFMIYNYPLLDTLDFITKNDKTSSKNDKTKLDEMDEMEKMKLFQTMYKAECMWPGAIRGRTVSNSYVVIDEVQNFSRKSLQTVISRLDKDCKVICIGSNRQIDNAFINKYTNGLSKLIKATRKDENSVTLFGTELTKVVRGPLTEFAEEVFGD